jgi:hypothetical protein
MFTVLVSVIGGSAEASVIVPVIAKVTVSSSVVALASWIACRREPAPASFVVVTVKVAACVVAMARTETTTEEMSSFIRWLRVLRSPIKNRDRAGVQA